MKHITSFRWYVCLACCLLSLPALAQPDNYITAKEKIYIHTNHVFYNPGDVAYFKLYLVAGKDQTPSTVSDIAYVELVAPSGTVAQKHNYKVTNGYTEGAFELNANSPGGVYKIRAYTTWMRNETDSTWFTKDITVQKTIAPRILLKLDFPQKGYGPGSAVSADFSMRNLAGNPIKYYESKYTVTVAGQTVNTGTFKTDGKGAAKVQFALPATLSSSDGLLNITVNYDAFTESISRSIPIVLNKIDLQFMPEGGTLVNGLATNMAFKAVNEFGKAADIKGDIVDDAGNRVATYDSYHFGMGQFAFTPQSGRSYHATISSPADITQQFPLPLAKDQGVVMNLVKTGRRLQLKLSATQPMPVVIVGYMKGFEYFNRTATLGPGVTTLEVDASVFPAGIAQFTLSDAGGLPLAERLCFVNENDILNIKITPEKIKYGPREKVRLTLETRNAKGEAVPSNFSLSVVDDKLYTMADDKQHHILSWLLMGSELRGKVEEPQFYFKKEELKALPGLDLVMLTHGYRYFEYTQLVKNEGRLQFLPEEGYVIGGLLKNSMGKPLHGDVFLVSNTGQGETIQSRTDAAGNFLFDNITPNQQYYLVAKTGRKAGPANIQLQQNGFGFNARKTPELKKDNPMTRYFFAQDSMAFAAAPAAKPALGKFDLGAARDENGKKAADLLKELPGIQVGIDGDIGRQNDDGAKPEGPWQGERNFAMVPMQNDAKAMQEVVVVGFGALRRNNMVGAVQVIRAEDIVNGNAFENQLAGKVAGVQVAQQANPGAAALLRIRGAGAIGGANQPLLVIDGIPSDKFVLDVNPNDIQNVTVLKDAAAGVLFGSRGANGVIMVETKNRFQGKNKINLTGKTQYSTLGVFTPGIQYTVARKFYAPQYRNTEAETRTDFRETIYWNPTVQTGNDGKAVLEFYNSDATTTFRAIAEGIGFNGLVGRSESTYAVENAMSADVKIPPYLTVGDKALLPLVIKNNRDESISISLAATAPAFMKLGALAASIDIKAGGSQKILVPAEAFTSGKGVISFTLQSPFNKETIQLPIEAAEKGFPIIQTFTGNKNSEHAFQINKMIPGSQKVSLKLFRSVEGQLLDGIESMLREPGGCFEQTSSTTYPNIFVLKYLREAGKSNPQIEKKARGYLENGYKRLAGYETAEHGFEWFGNTPPHESLTAYGLLEFTDMQEFIKVDKAMLERTKAFLLKRRDGNGGFKLVTGGYDAFASVPNKIANTYIVYALSKAGMGAEITKEYNAAVLKALDSKDAYQLAMTALSASYQKNDGDFKKLIAALEQTELKSETSVVNSRDASLRVETAALYAMALMREKTPRLAQIANLIGKIMGEKSYYGYGSTQATVLALNAVVDYSKLMGRMIETAQTKFTFNNQPVQEQHTLDSLVRNGGNSFTVQFAKASETLPYELEVGYSTFTPPNSDKAELKINTRLDRANATTGETVRLTLSVTNEKDRLQPMAIAKIGIPAGLSLQPWQLKELMEKNQAAYYEIFDNYLVIYWMGFKGKETKTIHLDLKAEIPGIYKGKASTTCLYYTPEHKHWNDGLEVEIK